jgi:hypothetical protein
MLTVLFVLFTPFFLLNVLILYGGLIFVEFCYFAIFIVFFAFFFFVCFRLLCRSPRIAQLFSQHLCSSIVSTTHVYVAGSILWWIYSMKSSPVSLLLFVGWEKEGKMIGGGKRGRGGGGG